jgi:hypothetical protein
MRHGFDDQVAAAVRATIVRSPVAYSWFGEPSESLPRAMRRELPPPLAREYLLYSLQSRLYQHFYCKGFAAPSEPDPPVGFRTADAAFVALLSAANAGGGCRAQGWTVRALEADGVVVQRNGLSLWVKRQDCLAPNEDALAPGTSVGLRLPPELPDRAPGFFTVLGNEDAAGDGGVVRLYWNLSAEGAADFVRAVSTVLNEARVPFHAKIVDHPARFTRCDAAVLYLPRSSYPAAAEWLPRIHRELAPFLKPPTPVFSKQLAPGLGLAEDPLGGESFGWHRCRLLADGLVRAYEQGPKSEAQRIETVAERFSEEGIRPETPYLNPGSNDIYVYAACSASARRHRRVRGVGAAVAGVDETFLQVALGIGERLSREAVWHREQCNWVGCSPTEKRAGNGRSGMTYTALGPELYSGTSGIALFCAELHGACGEVGMRKLALGAMRHALAPAGTVRPRERLGLFTGWPGIALAAARVGRLLDADELLERASELSSQAVGGWPDEREFDLLSGDAGAIVALLALRPMLPGQESGLLAAAVRLGEDLLRTAIRTEAGHSWRSPTLRSPRNLTGFSHGTAGVAFALLELSAATGEPQFRQAAIRAFDYERHWFDAAAGNWPDFRQSASRAGRSTRPHRFGAAWCHGAPGIALSRLRACELMLDETCAAEAIAALNTTRRALEESLRYRTGNWSLCHGLAGNAEVLLHGERVLGSRGGGWKATVLEVAAEGVRSHARSGHRWPCVAGGGDTPSLMLGLAGIGYFYLRLHSPSVPSVLLWPRS